METNGNFREDAAFLGREFQEQLAEKEKRQQEVRDNEIRLKWLREQLSEIKIMINKLKVDLRAVRQLLKWIEGRLKKRAPLPEEDIFTQLLKAIGWLIGAALLISGAVMLLSWAMEIILYGLPHQKRLLLAVVIAVTAVLALHAFFRKVFPPGDDGRPQISKVLLAVLAVVVVLNVVWWAKVRGDFAVLQTQKAAGQLTGQQATQATSVMEKKSAVAHTMVALAIEGTAAVCFCYGASLLFVCLAGLKLYRERQSKLDQESAIEKEIIELEGKAGEIQEEINERQHSGVSYEQ